MTVLATVRDLDSSCDATPLGRVLRELGADRCVEVSGGGSGAKSVRATTERFGDVFVKALQQTVAVADGHDLATFRTKPSQVRLLTAASPELGNRYPALLGSMDGADWSVQVYRHVDGVTLAELVRTGDAAMATEAVVDALAYLMELGYGVRVISNDLGGSFVAANHSRVFRRARWIRRILTPDLVRPAPVVVNEFPCVPALSAAATVAGPGRIDDLEPRRLYLPAHGDLNLRNVLVRPGAAREAVTFVDPRGSLTFFDPIYDLAKVVFSLTVWDAALREGLDVSTPVSAGTAGYVVSFRSPPGKVAIALADALPSHLERLPGWADLLDATGRRRLAYTVAFHCLAEASCVLSADQVAAETGRTRIPAANDVALGLYLKASAAFGALREGADWSAFLNVLAA